MQTSAKIIADSIDRHGNRLTTMEVTLHRFVLAEFNTHRVFSRNSASSRAIPVEKQLTKVVDSPAWPIEWPREQPGMQGGSELEDRDLALARGLFQVVWEDTTSTIQAYLDVVESRYPEDTPSELKSHTLHKSLINRLLEPFMWHTIIVTSTEWENFFAQRCSPLAQPEIREAAYLMQREYRNSIPEVISEGHWHLPYVSGDEIDAVLLDNDQNWDLTIDERYRILCEVSAARCARVSYLTQDGVRDMGKDRELFERLATASPPHWSPLEHVARPIKRTEPSVENSVISLPGNFTGWVQLRHIVDPNIGWLN
jgi:thymidylate synthase ThyX